MEATTPNNNLTTGIVILENARRVTSVVNGKRSTAADVWNLCAHFCIRANLNSVEQNGKNFTKICDFFDVTGSPRFFGLEFWKYKKQIPYIPVNNFSVSPNQFKPPAKQNCAQYGIRFFLCILFSHAVGKKIVYCGNVYYFQSNVRVVYFIVVPKES